MEAMLQSRRNAGLWSLMNLFTFSKSRVGVRRLMPILLEEEPLIDVWMVTTLVAVIDSLCGFLILSDKILTTENPHTGTCPGTT